MDWLTFAFGVFLLLAAMLDLIWTTLWVNGGGGPITSGVERAVWPLLKALSGERRRSLAAAGPIILIFTIAAWVLLIWAGWFLVLISDPAMVVSSASKLPAEWTERLYFAGYTIFTLGNGGFQPASHAGQIATVLASGTGLFAITLAITYLLSVISAAVSARALASQVSTLGEKPAEVIAASWNGRDYSDLRYPLQTLTQQLAQFGQQQLAYPVLQYFHAYREANSPFVALLRLEQIVAIAEHGVPAAGRPPQLLLKATRSSIDQIVQVLPERFTKRANDHLPLPDLSPLASQGLPVLTAGEFGKGLESRDQTRRAIASLIGSHGWSMGDLDL